MTNTIVTTIDGVGSVEASNDLACFTLTVRDRNENLERAQSEVAEKTDQIIKILKSSTSNIKFEGEITTDTQNYKLEHREGNEKIPAGFQVITRISFTVVVDDNLNAIYRACLKLDSQMSRPIFSMRDQEPHLEMAIQNAADNAKEKLKKECSLLGISTDSLMIQNWSFGYEGHLPSLNFATSTRSFYDGKGTYQGVTGPQGAQGSPGPMGPTGPFGRDSLQPVIMKVGSIYQEPLDFVEITPGGRTFTMAVRINYVWADDKTK